ncbi:uncharacterized protein LOC125721950 [Brienomyrus brachyistius]|uniref:uncharacterized protein LOC125721950 n=1 Tax=Brienomyrus brachyistius TaxID=42636 RepID=UPI0020B415B0|nr:uncharacterized protein LOC125721950 [Brienomyrus brachyistius]
MSIVKTTVNLQRIDWLLPKGAVSVRIAPEYIPGPVGRGQTSSSDAGRRKKCRTRPPAASSLTTSASPGSAAIPVATSRGQQGTGRRRKTAGGRSGRRRRYDQQKGLEPKPSSPTFSSSSFLFPSSAPSPFVSSPFLFMGSSVLSPHLLTPVSPAPHPYSAPGLVHLTPLLQAPAQAVAASSHLEKFYWLYNYYVTKYSKMTYDAKCFTEYWCQEFWNRHLNEINLAKQGKNEDNEGTHSTKRRRIDEDEFIFPIDALEQLSTMPRAQEMGVEMGYQSDAHSYISL